MTNLLPDEWTLFPPEEKRLRNLFRPKVPSINGLSIVSIVDDPENRVNYLVKRVGKQEENNTKELDVSKMFYSFNVFATN